MKNPPSRRAGSRLSALLVSLLVAGAMGLAAQPDLLTDGHAGAVFVGTNHNNSNTDPRSEELANQVVMYLRGPDGMLAPVGIFATGGQGSGPGMRFAGNGLGSSHSMQLSQDGRLLFVVNAGSDTLSVFRVHRGGLRLMDVVPTGDSSPSQRFPNSVAVHGDLVYVLNAAGDGSLNGFVLDRRCEQLVPIPGSTRILAANQLRYPPDSLLCPAQVAFTPDGRQLVVTIKDGADGLDPDVPPSGPGRILLFGVDRRSGLLSERFARNDSSNQEGPFGFSFDRRGNLLVAFAFAGAAASYRINPDGTLTAISRANPDAGSVDLCWLENNGRYAYAASYGAGIISGFRLGADGGLALLDPRAGVPDAPVPARSQGPTPIDLGISRDGRFLYGVLPGSGKVAGWRLNRDGSLTKVGEFNGLGQTVDGDMAPFDFGPGHSPAGIAVF